VSVTASLAAPVQHDDVRSFDGTRLRCWTIGRGTPVLVANPASIHPKAWLGVAALLDGALSFVTWEPRGMWDSAMPADESIASIPDHGRDLAAIARAMGLERSSVIGYCAGALSVCEALQDEAFAPAKAMFISAPLRHSEAERGFATFMSRLRERPQGWPAMRSVCLGFTPPELRDSLDVLLQNEPQTVRFLRTLQSCYDHDANIAFRQELPICLVIAAQDNVSIKTSNHWYLQHRVRATDRLFEVPGSHYFIIHQPDVAARIIGEWFDFGPRVACSISSGASTRMSERVDFSRNAAVYDRRHGSFLAPEATRQLAAAAGLGPQSRMLDIGAGTGRVAIPFASCCGQVVGIDVAHSMLANLQTKAAGQPIPTIVADACRMPFRERRFDAVVVARLLYLVPAWLEMLDEALRVLKPGGHVLHEWGNGGATEEWVQIRDRARAIFEDAGVVDPFHPGVRTEAEVDRFLAERGLTLVAAPEFEADVQMTLREFLDRIGNGECSYTWKLPPDVQQACVPKLMEWATARFDLTHIVASPIAWKVYRSSAS
jgi:SAM-dependent methyltransferase